MPVKAQTARKKKENSGGRQAVFVMIPAKFFSQKGILNEALFRFAGNREIFVLPLDAKGEALREALEQALEEGLRSFVFLHLGRVSPRGLKTVPELLENIRRDYLDADFSYSAIPYAELISRGI